MPWLSHDSMMPLSWQSVRSSFCLRAVHTMSRLMAEPQTEASPTKTWSDS
jgi:hypothetical protein